MTGVVEVGGCIPHLHSSTLELLMKEGTAVPSQYAGKSQYEYEVSIQLDLCRDLTQGEQSTRSLK